MEQAVLVIGDHQQSITVVRSLARARYRVIVGCKAKRTFSALSRFAHGAWPHPQPADRAAFIAALWRLLAARSDLTHLFPVGEAELRALVDDYPRLSQRVRIAMPQPDVVRSCLDKPRSFELAAGLGVPLVPTAVAGDNRELLAEAETMGLPLVIKHVDSSRLLGGRKAVVCHTHADLDRRLPMLAAAPYPLIVQRWFGGARHNCQFAARAGELTAYFEQRVLRTDAADGTGFGVEGMSVAPSPALRRHCAALARLLDYDGVGCVQFLVDAVSGDYRFLELNPRLDATCELAYRCGIDLPRLAFDRVDTALADYPTGRRFHWLLGDVRALSHRVKQSGISRRELAATLRRTAAAHWRAHDRLTWEWSDPLPTLFLYGRAVVAGGRNYVRGTVAERPH